MFNKGMSGLWRWNLFWWKVEGVDPLNGINVIHPDDPSSAGFVIKVGPVGFRVRYSKRVKKWFVGIKKFDATKGWFPFAWSLSFGSSGIQATEEHREYDKLEGKYTDEAKKP